LGEARAAAAGGGGGEDAPFWVLGRPEPTEADATVYGFVAASLVCTAYVLSLLSWLPTPFSSLLVVSSQRGGLGLTSAASTPLNQRPGNAKDRQELPGYRGLRKENPQRLLWRLRHLGRPGLGSEAPGGQPDVQPSSSVAVSLTVVI